MGYEYSPKWYRSKYNNKNTIFSINRFNYIQKRYNSNISLSNNNKYSNRLFEFLNENNLNPIFSYENLQLNETRNNILKYTKGLSGIYLILNKITLDFYIGSASTNRFYARFSNHLIYFRGALWSGISLLCLKLSNSGNTLKLMMPNYNWKIISGWSNYSCTVTSHKMIEIEIGNRGSKSVAVGANNAVVKEQRVDGSWCVKNNSHLRYTLMGCENSYQLNNPSNQINSQRFYTTLVVQPKKLDPWFITGFTDAEGCFTMSVVKHNKNKLGWAVKLSFQIGLHEKDKALLEQIKLYFKVGNLSKHGKQMVHFRTESIKDLAKIINHFDKYPLLTKKFGDYTLFKEAYYIMLNKEHLTKEGLKRFVQIKASINKGLSKSLSLAFPNIIIIDKLLTTESKVSDPNWIAGFASGEACFFINITKSSNSRQGFYVQLIFQLTQHARDELLMRSLIEYFNSGNVFKGNNTHIFKVTKFSDLTEKIIPFFKNYPILGAKTKDFYDWLLVIELMKNKAHLTKEGLEHLKLIKANMNKKNFS